MFISLAQELQHVHSSSGGLPAQSAVNTPRFPGGVVVLRLAHTSSGIVPVSSVSLKKAIPRNDER